MSKIIVSIENATKIYYTNSTYLTKKSTVIALDKVSLDIYKGEILGVVGESGSGKTTLGQIALGLIPLDEGSVKYCSKSGDIHNLSYEKGEKLRLLRKEIQLISQSSITALNPNMTVYESVSEGLLAHKIYNKHCVDLHEYVEEILNKCGIEKEYMSRYPHTLSTGQRQRVCIARAVALKPKFIVCDEVVSSLDMCYQCQILALLKEMRDKEGLTYLFISHDLRVVKYLCDRVIKIYDGKIII